MDNDNDVIIFYGPPFGGKTAYFHHNLKATHHRVSATELYEENPEIGLRQVILKIAVMLREGKKIVIDDENWTKSVRTSYVKTLSAKIPKCKFLCVKFNPEELISYWSMEWYLAEKTLQRDFSHRLCDLKKATMRLQRWYGKRDDNNLKLEEPQQQEMAIKVVKPKLLAHVDYKFEVPGLIVQWEAVIIESSDGSCSINSGLVDVIKCWLGVNPWGRIILVFDRFITKRDSAHSDSAEEQSIDNYKPLLRELCQDVQAPLYFFQVQTPAAYRNFCCPPKPGNLAFLQRLHNLNLFHRHTLYLNGSSDHYKMADETGVRHVSTKTILRNPQMVINSKCATKVSVKTELKNISFKPKPGNQRPLPVIPLFESAKENEWFYEELLPWNYTHGICFNDLSVLERYQQLYADTASKLSETGSRMVSHYPPESKTKDQVSSQASVRLSETSEKVGCQTLRSQSSSSYRAIPSWLVSKNTKQQKNVADLEEAGPPSLDSSEEDQPVTKKKKTLAQPSTIYCMNVLELLETAQLALLKDGKRVPVPVGMTKTTHDSKPARVGKDESVVATKQKKHEISKDLPSHQTQHVVSKRNKTVSVAGGLHSKVNKHDMSHKSAHLSTINAKYSQRKKLNVPETITTIPETAYFSPAASASETSLEKDKGQFKSDEKDIDMATRQTTQTKSGPDLSFLDDIF